MSMIDFLEKHGEVLQDSLSETNSLKSKLEELQSSQLDYQGMADKIYDLLEKEDLLPRVDSKIKVGDEIIGVGEYDSENLEGRKGKVDYISPGRQYRVLWEELEFRGYLSKNAFLSVDAKNVKKDIFLRKPKIFDQKSYNDFISELRGGVGPWEEYLDSEDIYFREGQLVELKSGIYGPKRGDRGLVIKRHEELYKYYVDLNGEEYSINPADMAKIKRRTIGEIKVGDKVEVFNVPKHASIREGSRGEVRRNGENKVLVRFKLLNGKKVSRADDPTDFIERNYLRIIRENEEDRIQEVIKNVEEEFNYSGYLRRRKEVIIEVKELAKKIVSSDYDNSGGLKEVASSFREAASIIDDYLNLKEKEIGELLK